MNNYKNLKDVENLAIGEHFIFGEYAGCSIEWVKVSADYAIALCILEKMKFSRTNTYNKSRIRTWCNELGEKLGLARDIISMPSEKELLSWYPTDEERKCDYSAELKKSGEDDGSPNYWTRSPSSCCYHDACIVYCSGSFTQADTYFSYLGIRPMVKLRS